MPRCSILLALIAAAGAASGCREADAIPAPPSFTLRLAQDPTTLDPAHAADAHSVAVVSQVFDGLVEFDPADLSVRPSLAATWETEEQGRRFVFRLREDARFHDGRRVTADDVVFSFERILSSKVKSPRRWVLRPIEGSDAYWDGSAERVTGLQAVDERTIAIALTKPFAPFLSHLSLEAASIVPRGTFDPRHPVGAGPFAFESWSPGERIVLKRPEGWSGEDGLIHRVVYRIIPSETTALQEYMTGGLHMTDEIPVTEREKLVASLEGQLHRAMQPAIAYLGFNHQRGPFAGNAALRKAFNHAVDKDYICRILNGGKDLPAGGVIPRGVPGHDPDLAGYPYDPEAAARFLADAGYPGGKGLPEITLHYNTSLTQQRIMERVRMDLERIGVRVNLVSLDPPALMASLGAGEPVFFRMAWLADIPDPDAFFTPALHSSSPPEAGNFARYANPEVDALIDRARGTIDPAARIALYREAQRLVVEDAAWLFLYHYGDEALVRPEVSGLEIPSLGEFLAPLSGVRVAPRSAATGF